MSLSNLSKDITENLFEPLILSELSDHQVIEKIKSDAVNYSKLKLLAQQAQLLKMQIQEVIGEGILNNNLHDVECRFKKVSGNTYHLYQKKNNKYIFSIISPSDWNNNPPYKYVASYLYDHDKCFRLV